MKLTEEQMMKLIFTQQKELIAKEYGKDAARNANYGWGSAEGSICTKVYVDPRIFLTTSYNLEQGAASIDHNWDN